ncbi:MAG: fluoride efflux transporter CrcB [Acidobacteriaceae bacterium]
MRAYFWVALGAVAGACLRFALARLASKWIAADFPYGTLFINITGSLILGFFMIWTAERVFSDVRWRWLIAIGFCGGYTTFSSFAFESMALFEQGRYALFAANVFLSNVLCLAAAMAGMALARWR